MKPLQDFYSFKNYASREDFEAKVGKAPPWNPERPLKYWADDNPTNTEIDEIRGEEATYRPVLSIQANGRYREGPDGQPLLGKITIAAEHAKTYNFPPPGGIFPPLGAELEHRTASGYTLMSQDYIANSQRIVQNPLNLPEGSRVVYAPGIGATVAVLLKGETLPSAATSGGFSGEDRKLLLLIRSEQSVQAETLGRIEELLVSFQNPAPK